MRTWRVLRGVRRGTTIIFFFLVHILEQLSIFALDCDMSVWTETYMTGNSVPERSKWLI